MKLNPCLVFISSALFLGHVAVAGALQDGTFTVIKPGQNADVPVTVTFKKGKIESVEVGPNKETVGIGQLAVQKLPAEIVKKQSPLIDGIGGASVTSHAILSAVGDAVKQAGGDPSSMKPIVDTKKAVAATVKLSTELVVVGGGASGMIAAINAAEQGLKVVLLEKMNFLGGASAICGGLMIVQGSELQKSLGVTDDSPTKMAYDLIVNGHKKNNLNGLTFYAENVGNAVDWLVARGVKADAKNGMAYRAEHNPQRAINLAGGCPKYAETLRELIAKNKNITVLLNTRATDIIMKDGVAVGVEARNAEGQKVTVDGKAILLATGGYGANKAMLNEDLKKVLYYGPVSATGDGHQMAQKVGAQMQMMEYGKTYPNGIEAAPGKALSTIQGNIPAFNQSGIIVGHHAKRVVNEKGAGKDILTVLLKEPDNTLYILMDKPSFDGFAVGVKRNGVTDAQLAKWLEDNGKSAPTFAHADTLEGVAKIVGLDPVELQKTVDRYNELVRKGKDEDFGRPVRFMKHEISNTGPYYIVEQKPRFATTMGGTAVSSKLQVLDKNGKPIPQLYAAGEMANNVHGDDSAPGANIGWGVTSGKAVSDVIVKELKGK